jgi:signal transduction histidine kinase
MASHELKTPVTTINGYVQLLLDVKAAQQNGIPPDADVFDSGLKTIHKQIGKLTSLISELLDLSRIQKGQLELQKSILDLAELVSDVVDDVQYTTRHKIEVTIESRDKVHADKDRIMQVVLNFITNAIKYSPDADRIEIRVFRRDANYAAVSVKDYGIGIDKADHEKIFERFYRAEGKKEKTFPGFGIGLFIASDIIKRHNGEIGVQSEKDKGSDFIFALPIATE